MSADDNKALVRRYFDLLNANDLDAVFALYTPDSRHHFGSVPTLDAAGVIGMIAQFLAAFPGMHHEVLDQVAADDRVATRIFVRGTHQADLMDIPASGRTIEIGVIYIHVIANGRIVEQWQNSDSLGMMQQLGAIPAPVASQGQGDIQP
jgi:steroid delta-isomerase-like uncharacterized protein